MSGDYGAATDFDVDGDVDLLVRKQGANDLYIDTGLTFGSSTNIDDATNSNKGVVAFCDFDGDADFDLLWIDNGTNQLWRQAPIGTFTATGMPSGITRNVDGVACGDVDNDGGADNYLFVRALFDVDGAGAGTTTRDAIGATLRLQDRAGNDISGVREVNGGRGHGSQDPAATSPMLPPMTPVRPVRMMRPGPSYSFRP